VWFALRFGRVPFSLLHKPRRTEQKEVLVRKPCVEAKALRVVLVLVHYYVRPCYCNCLVPCSYVLLVDERIRKTAGRWMVPSSSIISNRRHSLFTRQVTTVDCVQCTTELPSIQNVESKKVLATCLSGSGFCCNSNWSIGSFLFHRNVVSRNRSGGRQFSRRRTKRYNTFTIPALSNRFVQVLRRLRDMLRQLSDLQ